MQVEFKAISLEGELIKSNCIIQKEMPYGIDIRLNVDTKWIRIKNETLVITLLTPTSLGIR